MSRVRVTFTVDVDFVKWADEYDLSIHDNEGIRRDIKDLCESNARTHIDSIGVGEE